MTIRLINVRRFSLSVSSLTFQVLTGHGPLTPHIKQYKPFLLQTLLQNNASAAFLNAQLSETEWRVSDVSDFLSKVSEDQRPAGSAYTWRDVFNETDQAIQTISRFMEVSVLMQDASTSTGLKKKKISILKM